MVLKLLRVTAALAVVVVAAGLLVGSTPAMGAQPRGGYNPGDLFYNYYVPPDPVWGLGAQLYISPRPIPPNVGHTFITYQPLMPHEFLYQHSRTYHRVHPDGTVTRTHVGWGHYLIP
jgi:hypothetical protein